MKRFKCSSVGKKLQALADITKKQYQQLGNTYEFDEMIKKEIPTLQNYSKSDLW